MLSYLLYDCLILVRSKLKYLILKCLMLNFLVLDYLKPCSPMWYS